MEIENAASLRRALHSGINLMLGSGFSTLANDATGKPLPVGGQLATELRHKFDVDPHSGLELAQLYTVLSARDRDSADSFLRARFTVGSFDIRYRRLADLNIRTLFTTNIDDLPWKIFESSQVRYLNDVLLRGPLFNDKAAVDYVPLHGSVLDDTRPFRFTTIEVASSFATDPTLWQTFKMRLASSPTLFWGYSLQDAASLQALKSQERGASAEAWIVLRPTHRGNALVEYFRALKFQIVFAETDEFLDFLQEAADETSTGAPAAAIAKSLDSHRIPLPSSVPQRAISEFYSGAAPAWADVFRTDVPRLEQFRTVENALNEGRDVVVTGIPASGKTTVLMQLAAADAGPGPSLMPASMTREGAEHLVRALAGSAATVYLDQFCQDVDAYNVLRLAENICVVAADRDYNVATVTHIMHRSGVRFVSMSDISDFDQGSIRKALPPSIRTRTMVRPQTASGETSLLDFNLANTTTDSLMTRLERALREFQRDGADAAEMLTLVSYVQSCGTVLSMDMAMAYWRDAIDDYNDVFHLVESVGRLMSDYDGYLGEGDQDHFTARSQVVADAVMRVSSSAVLRQVLERFHGNISTARISRFDVFRRRGYHHKTVGRAFPKVDDGVRFYDFLLTKDDNPYLLQQKALLLSARGQYQDSFVAIDQALVMSKSKNWRIHATHAELLFDANFHLAAESLEAREQVDRAMELLRRCYVSDRRRALHAFSYSERALRYQSQFGDDRAKAYLEQSEDWLEVVQRDEPYMTSTKWRLREVRSKLDTVGS